MERPRLQVRFIIHIWVTELTGFRCILGKKRTELFFCKQETSSPNQEENLTTDAKPLQQPQIKEPIKRGGSTLLCCTRVSYSREQKQTGNKPRINNISIRGQRRRVNLVKEPGMDICVYL